MTTLGNSSPAFDPGLTESFVLPDQDITGGEFLFDLLSVWEPRAYLARLKPPQGWRTPCGTNRNSYWRKAGCVFLLPATAVHN
jgi:hypothetical protein